MVMKMDIQRRLYIHTYVPVPSVEDRETTTSLLRAAVVGVTVIVTQNICGGSFSTIPTAIVGTEKEAAESSDFHNTNAKNSYYCSPSTSVIVMRLTLLLRLMLSPTVSRLSSVLKYSSHSIRSSG